MSQLQLGRWQDVLADLDTVDALICDPPYSARTHAGSDAVVDGMLDAADRHRLGYRSWGADDVQAFVGHWSQHTRGWIVAFSDDLLAPHWRSAFRLCHLYDFAPLPCLQHRPRLVGDGPASCAVYLMVARPKRKEFLSWGSLPGWYISRPERAPIMGSKPLDLMRAIIRDYSRPGDLVCDPCAGLGTTLLAAAIEGRRSVGAEMSAATHALASTRLEREFDARFVPGSLRPRQQKLGF